MRKLSQYMPEDDHTNFKTNRNNIIPTLLEEIVNYVDKNGYTETGVMCKHFDVLTGKPIADIEKNGQSYITAPWWNVRETATAAIKLYQLTANQRMWDVYKRAFNTTYKNYHKLTHYLCGIHFLYNSGGGFAWIICF